MSQYQTLTDNDTHLLRQIAQYSPHVAETLIRMCVGGGPIAKDIKEVLSNTMAARAGQQREGTRLYDRRVSERLDAACDAAENEDGTHL